MLIIKYIILEAYTNLTHLLENRNRLILKKTKKQRSWIRRQKTLKTDNLIVTASSLVVVVVVVVVRGTRGVLTAEINIGACIIIMNEIGKNEKFGLRLKRETRTNKNEEEKGRANNTGRWRWISLLLFRKSFLIIIILMMTQPFSFSLWHKTDIKFGMSTPNVFSCALCFSRVRSFPLIKIHFAFIHFMHSSSFPIHFTSLYFNRKSLVLFSVSLKPYTVHPFLNGGKWWWCSSN